MSAAARLQGVSAQPPARRKSSSCMTRHDEPGGAWDVSFSGRLGLSHMGVVIVGHMLLENSTYLCC